MTASEDMTELEKKYPRIVEKITLLWGHDDISSFLSHLLIDERGDRQGFPMAVISDIMFLFDLNKEENEHLVLSGKALWDNPLVKDLKS